MNRVLFIACVMWHVIMRTVAGVLRYSVSIWLALLKEQNNSLAAKQWAIAHNDQGHEAFNNELNYENRTFFL